MKIFDGILGLIIWGVMGVLVLLGLLMAISSFAYSCPLDFNAPIPPLSERSCNRAFFPAVPYSIGRIEKTEYYGLDDDGLDLATKELRG